MKWKTPRCIPIFHHWKARSAHLFYGETNKSWMEWRFVGIEKSRLVHLRSQWDTFQQSIPVIRINGKTVSESIADGYVLDATTTVEIHFPSKQSSSPVLFHWIGFPECQPASDGDSTQENKEEDQNVQIYAKNIEHLLWYIHRIPEMIRTYFPRLSCWQMQILNQSPSFKTTSLLSFPCPWIPLSPPSSSSQYRDCIVLEKNERIWYVPWLEYTKNESSNYLLGESLEELNVPTTFVLCLQHDKSEGKHEFSSHFAIQHSQLTILEHFSSLATRRPYGDRATQFIIPQFTLKCVDDGVHPKGKLFIVFIIPINYTLHEDVLFELLKRWCIQSLAVWWHYLPSEKRWMRVKDTISILPSELYAKVYLQQKEKNNS